MISALTRPTFTWNRQVQRSGIVVLALTAVAWSLAVLPLDLLMVCAASFAAVVTVLRWPWLVWPAAAIALPVASGTKLGVISVSELILLAAVCLWLMDGARRSRLETFAGKIFVPIGLYIGVLSISLLHAPALADGIAEVVKWAEFALVLALLPTMVTARNAIWVIAALVLAGALQQAWAYTSLSFKSDPSGSSSVIGSCAPVAAFASRIHLPATWASFCRSHSA